MDLISTNDSMRIIHPGVEDTKIEDEKRVRLWDTHTGLMVVYYGSAFLFFLVAFIVNYKLFDSVRKESHGDSGKALQWILKTFALIQAIGWPSVVLGWYILMETVFAYGDLLNSCIVMYCAHVLVFSFMYMRAYVGLNSLILAFGRYAFVVHHVRILKFGQIRMGRILKSLCFIIPLFTTLLASSIAPVRYTGWFSGLKKHDHLCYMTYNSQHNSSVNDEFYRSPIYKLAHLLLSPFANYCMYIVFIVTSVMLYSNVTEGIVYIKCVIFVVR